MKVEIKLNSDRKAGTCRVTREEGDPKYHTDSHLLYALKKWLNRRWPIFIKKLMWKDGHLVGHDKHYLRSRAGVFPMWAIHDGAYAIRFAHEAFNAGETVKYLVEDITWEDNKGAGTIGPVSPSFPEEP